jgi:TRAP-type mannitol/chloroaromatic compound transport system permease small subunit
MENTGTSIKISDAIDGTIIRIGNALAWLNAVLLVLIIVQVILRYVFADAFVAFDELEWHLYAVNVMFGLAYGVATGSHIRLDVVSNNFSPRRKAKIEIAGGLFLTIPWIVVVTMHGWDFFYNAWKIGECSISPLGLPFRWIVKSFIPLGFLLLGLAIVSQIIRAFALLITKDQ